MYMSAQHVTCHKLYMHAYMSYAITMSWCHNNASAIAIIKIAPVVLLGHCCCHCHCDENHIATPNTVLRTVLCKLQLGRV